MNSTAPDPVPNRVDVAQMPHESVAGRTVTALLICGGAALVLAILLKSIAGGLVAEAAAIVCFALHPTVAESLERNKVSFSSKVYGPWFAALSGLATVKRSGTANLSPSVIVHGLHHREPPWYVVFFYVASAAVLFTLFDFVIGFLLGIILRVAGVAIAGGGAVLFILVVLAVNGIFGFLIGSWIGSGRSHHQYLTAFAMVVCAQIMGQALNAVIGVESAGAAVGAMIVGSIIWSIPTSVGVWRGVRVHSAQAQLADSVAAAAPDVSAPLKASSAQTVSPTVEAEPPAEADVVEPPVRRRHIWRCEQRRGSGRESACVPVRADDLTASQIDIDGSGLPESTCLDRRRIETGRKDQVGLGTGGCEHTSSRE